MNTSSPTRQTIWIHLNEPIEVKVKTCLKASAFLSSMVVSSGPGGRRYAVGGNYITGYIIRNNVYYTIKRGLC